MPHVVSDVVLACVASRRPFRFDIFFVFRSLASTLIELRCVCPSVCSPGPRTKARVPVPHDMILVNAVLAWRLPVASGSALHGAVLANAGALQVRGAPDDVSMVAGPSPGLPR